LLTEAGIRQTRRLTSRYDHVGAGALMAELHVRQAAPADIERIAQVFVAVDLCKPEGLEPKIRQCIDRCPETCLVVLDGDDCIGAALSVFNGFHVFLSHIAVVAERQRTGAGKLLHEALVERARQLGAAGIITDSWLTSTGFYYHLGYHVPGAIFLIRSLTP
jgi:GNAT superfamily N-acetyltransferase